MMLFTRVTVRDTRERHVHFSVPGASQYLNSARSTGNYSKSKSSAGATKWHQPIPSATYELFKHKMNPQTKAPLSNGMHTEDIVLSLLTWSEEPEAGWSYTTDFSQHKAIFQKHLMTALVCPSKSFSSPLATFAVQQTELRHQSSDCSFKCHRCRWGLRHQSQHPHRNRSCHRQILHPQASLCQR